MDAFNWGACALLATPPRTYAVLSPAMNLNWRMMQQHSVGARPPPSLQPHPRALHLIGAAVHQLGPQHQLLLLLFLSSQQQHLQSMRPALTEQKKRNVGDQQSAASGLLVGLASQTHPRVSNC